MKARRWAPLIVVIASVTFALAQPKKQPAPAPTPSSGTGTGAGTAAGSAVEPVEEPPADMEGTSENPGAPRIPGEEEKKVVEVKTPEKKDTGYPIEEAARPINLPKGMAEVSIGPRFMASVGEDPPLGGGMEGIGYVGSDTLRARYGITREFQLGLSYVLGAIYDDPKTTSDKLGFHPGKAIGLDGQYLITSFAAVKVGVPVWIYRPEPDGGAPAIGLTIGVPLKFRFFKKLAIGGLDDFLAIKITKFAPTFEHEYLNAYRAAGTDLNTPASRGFIRFAGYAVYQQNPKLALIGRFGVTLEDFTGTRSDRGGGSVTHLRGGIEYTVKRYLDVGVTAGFEDLSVLGTFGLTTLLAFRI